MKRFTFIALAVALLTIGCASLEAETPKQRAFAAVADYTAMQSVARAYGSRPTANADVKESIKDIVIVAWPIVLVLEDMANEDTLTFCGVSDILPDGLGADVAALACAGDIESVTGKTMVFAGALRLIITELGDDT